MSDSARVILYHKHSTSARTRFVRFSYDSVLGPRQIPKLATLYEHDAQADTEAVKDGIATQVAEAFRIPADKLVFEEEFDAVVEVPNALIPVYLLRLTTMDPPFENVEAQGAKFIALTEARSLPDVELQLLQKAYKVIMEG